MVAAGARTHPLRCFAIRVLSSDSCRRRNIMLFRYRFVAVAMLCSSDIDSCRRRNVMLFGYRLVAGRSGCPESELRST